MDQRTEKIIANILTLAFLAFFCMLAVTSTAIFEGADNIAHYNLSHYSFRHPELLLDHWGKPLFTILSSPFSQAGFVGTKLFNVLTGVAAAYFAYRYLRSQKVQMAFAVIPFVLFVPMYFMMMQSALTEVLCSFILVVSAFCFADKRYILSAILLSFVPVSRTDAVIILPVYAAALLWFRQYKALPFLLTGTFVFSISGWFQYGDILWLIHNNPYKGASSLYGKGDLLHFVEQIPYICGIPLTILTVTGIFSILFRFFRNNAHPGEPATADVFVLLLPALALLAAHSYLWWKGLGGSAGLTRVLTPVLPLTAIMAYKGFDEITWRIPVKWVRWLILLVVLFFIILVPVRKYRPPAKLQKADLLMSQTADWIKSEGLQNRNIFYYDPEVAFFNDRDPWNHEKGRQIIRDGFVNETIFGEGSLIIWDAHFGPHEGRVPLSLLLENKQLRLIKILLPNPPFTIYGNEEYCIYVFLKDRTHAPHDNFAIEKELRSTHF
ncbi:MAG TPA: hypothetical protein PKI35_04070 [Bacteroidales bacterium]|nr:hypothetical protein [Bacteroidales bacterium]